MVSPIDTIKVNYKLDVDYSLLLHKSWLPHLNGILNTEYMRNMMVFLHEIYKVKYVTPAQNDLFKPFALTNYNDLEVVILADKPFVNLKMATGLALASPDSSLQIHEDTNALRKCIEKTCYRGFALDFDYSLETWAKQGVLMLNSSMTHIEMYDGADGYTLWRNFIREVIKQISSNRPGTQFLLLGEQAQYFKRYISKELCYVYEYELPKTAINKGVDWDCPYFEEINHVIDKNNGPEFCIDW